MRFTKIPLIATLMAVALSLLIVLPGLAQTTDVTDGKKSAGVVTAGVFANIGDAELPKLVAASGDGAEAGVFVPISPEPTPPPNQPDPLEATDTHAADGEAAHLMSDLPSPRDTLFRNTLYVSNNAAAYNTILINVGVETGTTTCVADTTADGGFGPNATVTATVKNNRSGKSVTLELAKSTTDNVQGFIKVVDDNATATLLEADGTAFEEDGEEVTVGYREHGGPTFCDTDETRDYDATPDDDTDTLTSVEKETPATGAIYGPVAVPGFYGQPLAADAPPVTQEIATIFAEHGDRLTITTTGGSGVIDLVVDGDGPEFTAVTPDDNAVTRPNRLTFSFEVRDDDSGLRHDGESVRSNDGDLKEINPDGDHALHNEPLSVDPGTAVSANGKSADIQVNVVENPRDGSDVDYDDISASGTWRMAGNRAGVAYAFSASGADRDDDRYLYQLVAKDRAGNTSMTDADSDTESVNEPYVFRVDDTEPELATVRTGITWNSANDEEEVDRSYVALTFTDGGDTGADALGDVDTDNITVVGHTVVGVIHPSERPEINRNTMRVLTAPTGPAPDAPGNEPRAVSEPEAAKTRTETHVPTTDGETARTGDLTLTDTCGVSAAPTAGTPGTATIEATDTTLTVAPITAEETAYCKAWDDYRKYLIAKNTYDAAKTAYDTYNQFKRENPGTDIEGDAITEPRSRVYLELAEDLAADATPDVVVVGGAVFDLAGNTNPAKTQEAKDWIAPSLAVTVTGTANDRPVVNEDGSFSVDVRSDEDLRRRPVVFFVKIAGEQTAGADTDATSDDKFKYTIMSVDEASPLTQQEDENHWARKYKRSSIDISVDDGGEMIGVVVLGHDSEDNSGATAGWGSDADHRDASNPASGNTLNLARMDAADLLVEIDEEFNNGGKDSNDNDLKIGEVTPRSDDDGEETESANPFVKLTFDGEDGEYTELVGFEDTDSHDRVNVTEITLNGENVMAHLNRVSATQFSLVLRDLAVDSYTVEYVAEDEAGNEMDDGEFSFEVKQRQPYEIEVQPGWNLISLPATPLEPGIADVLSGNQYISPVLGYQEGDWITAVREDDGTWRGRLTEIAGGYGYWVHARTFESVETMLSEVDPAGVLPTVPVTAGWNLLGVLDIFQNGVGDPPGEKSSAGEFTSANYEADNYFSSIDWKVAYTYDTQHSRWEKTTPENPDPEGGPKEIKNGKGYWVWSPAPNTLVP